MEISGRAGKLRLSLRDGRLLLPDVLVGAFIAVPSAFVVNRRLIVKKPSRIQPKDQIELFYDKPAPWKYDNNPHALIRKEYLLKILPSAAMPECLTLAAEKVF